MDNKKVYIKNISNHTIIVVEPSIRLRAQLRPMAHFPVKAEDFDILANHYCFIQLVRAKKLQVEDVEAGLETGLIDQEEVKQDKDGNLVQEHTEDYIAIRKLLEKGTDLEVKELLNASSTERKEMIGQIAMDCKDISYNQTKLDSNASGIDIEKARSLER